MFTLRFESDSRGSGPGIVWMVGAQQYRVVDRGDSKDIGIPNEHGVEVYHQINGEEGCYDRCFVMNAQGRTVARFDADLRAIQSPPAERASNHREGTQCDTF